MNKATSFNFTPPHCFSVKLGKMMKSLYLNIGQSQWPLLVSVFICSNLYSVPGGGGTLPMFGYMGAAEGLKS